MVTDPCCCRVKDPDMVLGNTSGYSYQAVPHCSRVSSSASLHCAHILWFLFFSISPPLTCSLVAPGGPRVSGVVSAVLCMTCALWHQAGVILDMVCPHGPVWCWSGGHLGLGHLQALQHGPAWGYCQSWAHSCQMPMVPGWVHLVSGSLPALEACLAYAEPV